MLYLNRGTWFDDATVAVGALGSDAALHRLRDRASFDVDLDGLLDIFVANGRVEFHAELVQGADVYAEPDQLLRQRLEGSVRGRVRRRRAPRSSSSRTGAPRRSADYDDDGDVDVLVVNRDGPARLLRNDSPRLGSFFEAARRSTAAGATRTARS